MFCNYVLNSSLQQRYPYKTEQMKEAIKKSHDGCSVIKSFASKVSLLASTVPQDKNDLIIGTLSLI